MNTLTATEELNILNRNLQRLDRAPGMLRQRLLKFCMKQGHIFGTISVFFLGSMLFFPSYYLALMIGAFLCQWPIYYTSAHLPVKYGPEYDELLLTAEKSQQLRGQVTGEHAEEVQVISENCRLLRRLAAYYPSKAAGLIQQYL